MLEVDWKVERAGETSADHILLQNVFAHRNFERFITKNMHSTPSIHFGLIFIDI